MLERACVVLVEAYRAAADNPAALLRDFKGTAADKWAAKIIKVG
jgi:hypothetical protein